MPRVPANRERAFSQPAHNGRDRYLTHSEAVRQDGKLEARILRAQQEGDRRKARTLMRLRQRMPASRLTAAYEANASMPRKFRVTKRQIHMAARDLDLRVPSREPAYVTVLTKENGGLRPIVNFGIQRRTGQFLLRKCYIPHARSRPDQYMCFNGGRPGACRAVREAILDGYFYAAELDVAKCYASFSERGVKELLRGLSPRAVEGYVLSKSVNHRWAKPYMDLNVADLRKLHQQVQSGISQGSCFSPLVAEILIGWLLDKLTDDGVLLSSVRLVNYADNILVLGRTQSDVENAMDHLRSGFRSSRLGPLVLRCKRSRSDRDVVSARQGFHFLGFKFLVQGSRVRVYVSAKNREKFVRKLMRWRAKFPHGSRDLDRRIASWAASMDFDVIRGIGHTRAASWARQLNQTAQQGRLSTIRQVLKEGSFIHKVLHVPGFL